MIRRPLKIACFTGLLMLTGCWNFDGGAANDNNVNQNNENGNENGNDNGNWINGQFEENYLLSGERQVDLLFVVDNSGSMAGEQATLRANFPALLTVLRNMFGGLPSLHVGVTTTDLGTGSFGIMYCETPGGDAGNLVKGSCALYPQGSSYLYDVEPSACDIVRNPDATCASHNCASPNCAHLNMGYFVEDPSTGCPRCRNYVADTLEGVFSCMADLGTMGCGFEQPLEAMYKALEPSNSANDGFLRENAYLAVVFVTDEDDCSASNPQVFDNTQTDINSTLGPLTSYRCFEFGITCDNDSRTHQGLRENCVPRDDPGALLHPISRYTDQLLALKDRRMVTMAALAGPVTPSANGVGLNMTIGLDDMSNPELEYSCTTAVDGAVPGIRIFNLVEQFNSPGELAAWAYRPICDADYSTMLSGLGNKLDHLITTKCLPAAPVGCADIGAEFGAPSLTDCAQPNYCDAQCTGVEITGRYTPGEVRTALTPCLHVLAGGTVDPTNTDPTLAYWGGHPETVDPNLPVAACWHISHEPTCTQSNQAAVAVSHQVLPIASTYVELSCLHLYPTEGDCGNNVDDDQDCLDDSEDPDCQS